MVQLLYDGGIGVSVQFCTQDSSKWLFLLREQGGNGEFHLLPIPAEAGRTAGGGVEVSTAENTSWDDSELTPEHYEVSDRIH